MSLSLGAFHVTSQHDLAASLPVCNASTENTLWHMSRTANRHAAQLCTGSCENVQSWQGILSFHDVGKAWAVCKAIYIRVSWCTCKSLVLGAQVSQHGVPQAQLLGCATHTFLCPNPTPHDPLLRTLSMSHLLTPKIGITLS